MTNTMMRDDATPALPGTPAGPLAWPPPGAERLHGAAWTAIALLAAGAFVVMLPLLWSVAAPRPFWSTSPFGEAWWVPAILSLAGLALVIGGMDRLVHVLLEGARAARRGLDWWTIATVAADVRRDAGFLRQGLKRYAPLDERRRIRVLACRVAEAAGATLGLLWVPLGFALALVLAGRDVIGRGGMLGLVLVPAAVFLLVAAIAWLLGEAATHGLAKTWRRGGSGEEEVRGEVEAWRHARAERLGTTVQAEQSRGRTRPARIAAGIVIALAILLPLPILALAAASTVGPVAEQVALPRMSGIAERAARALLLEPHVLPPDRSITPLQAGEALQVLAFTGSSASRSVSALEREPVRRYAEPWPVDAAPATLERIERIMPDPFARAFRLTPAERAWLEEAARHPAHREIALLARAPGIDIGAGRWDMSTIDQANVYELPITRLAGLRDAAHFHIGRAMLEAADGDLDAAETTLREVVSLGLLMSREGPLLLDMLIGSVIAGLGGSALESFYAAAGRTADAAAIRERGEGLTRMAGLSKALGGGEGSRSMNDAFRLALDEDAPRALRWESFITVEVGGACLNAHTALFGRGADHGRWVDAVRTSLVRYPSEQALFDAARRGLTQTETGDGTPAAVQWLLGGLLGRSEAGRTCGGMLSALSM